MAGQVFVGRVPASHRAYYPIPVMHLVFAPAHRIDRSLRPDYWEPR